jgi:uncharacterized cupin superfamily protein
MVKAGAFDVKPLQEQLAAHPELWDGITLRKAHPKSPHREVEDIWVRYNPLENYHGDMEAFNGPHVAKWYPVVKQLPAAKDLSLGLMKMLGMSKLGFVLITHLAPGKQVYPHVDGGWHAKYYEKFCIQVKGNQNQAFCFDDGELRASPGDVYWFKNSFPHWVTNNSDQERISMIVCLRR